MLCDATGRDIKRADIAHEHRFGSNCARNSNVRASSDYLPLSSLQTRQRDSGPTGMSALDAYHRKQKLSRQCRRTRRPTTLPFEARNDFALPLNMPLSFGDVPIGCL
jgi:hypothetical protein